MILLTDNGDVVARRIRAMVDNPANIQCRMPAVKRYVMLAGKMAERLVTAGRKEQANCIWEATAPFYERFIWENNGHG